MIVLSSCRADTNKKGVLPPTALRTMKKFLGLKAPIDADWCGTEPDQMHQHEPLLGYETSLPVHAFVFQLTIRTCS